MTKSRLIGELRKKAINTLRESTETLERASRQRESGDLEEAEKAHELARSKRAEAERLMSEARRLETSTKSDK